MTTEKLYYADSHLFSFSATVMSCFGIKDAFGIILDKTAFFPEGGGQKADTGFIGDVEIYDVQEIDGNIIHFAARSIEPGRRCDCIVNAEQRLRRMQAHSGEHIFSGIAHSMYGCENVGFHMSSEFVTIDFDRELSNEQLELIECKANEAVCADLPVKAYFPKSEQLKDLNYRSKIELTHDVRIVEIPGVDICACCAPHVLHTGEVGCIRVIESMRHRGGVRVSVTFGQDALQLFRAYKANLSEISAALSVPKTETAAAVKKVQAEKEALKQNNVSLQMRIASMLADKYRDVPGNICFVENDLNDTSLRELINSLAINRNGIVAVLSGSDAVGYRYIIGSRSVDLRKASREINSGINGKGGGRNTMIQGTSAAAISEIVEYITHFVLYNIE